MCGISYSWFHIFGQQSPIQVQCTFFSSSIQQSHIRYCMEVSIWCCVLVKYFQCLWILSLVSPVVHPLMLGTVEVRRQFLFQTWIHSSVSDATCEFAPVQPNLSHQCHPWSGLIEMIMMAMITMIMFVMIYILWWSVCLCVTKNDHFLLGVSCDHLNPP